MNSFQMINNLLKLGNRVIVTPGVIFRNVNVPFNNNKRFFTSKLRVKDKQQKKENLAAVLYGIEDLRLEPRPLPEISSNEVLLEMDCIGICGSDVNHLINGRTGEFTLNKPLIIGHECSGVITEIGKDVKGFLPGDRVAVEPGVSCRNCSFCKEGRYNLCDSLAFCATPPTDGVLSKYYKHPGDFCFKLPSNVSMEEGALLESLSIGVHACSRAKVTLGSDVLIIGAGPIGLVTLLVAKAMGATNTLVTDLDEQRLKIARDLGANDTLLAKDVDENDLITEIHTKMSTEPSKTIDCAGYEITARQAILTTKRGGIVVMVGTAAREANIPLLNASTRQIDIKGAYRYANNFPIALSLISSGAIDVKKLITHHFDITDTPKAFQVARSPEENAVKVMIHCQPRNKNNSR